MKLSIQKKRIKDPRVENLLREDFTRTPNSLLEQLALSKTGISKNEIQVILAILRKTLGWGKLSDKLSRTQLQKLTGLDVSVISKATSNLKKRGILIEYAGYSWKSHRPYEWSIEYTTENWRNSLRTSEKLPNSRIYPQKQGANNHRKLVLKHPTTIETEEKETVKYSPQNRKANPLNIKETKYEPIENRKSRY